MKIRLTTIGTSICVDMPEETAGEMFGSLAAQLLGFEQGEPVVKADPDILSNLDSEARLPKAIVDHMAECAKEQISKTYITNVDPMNPPAPVMMQPKSYHESGLYSYKGFLYLECEHCGQDKGMCVKEKMTWYQCECGERTPFEQPLIPLHVNCECERYFKYQTNLDKYAFDIQCINCNSPVAVKYNPKKKQYDTIRD